ncbi:helix-turn-helix domain-containing protein [Paenarthrobacter nitroguajacolicus]|uniref:helix-turn-helix transcriptional regulator n=1 Tax=Paenarthrobacter nitroguajacolicus TaxID=211146 RepID=UPI0015BE490C|nr:helix-turn-helix domain-containing protein [Paenarthrobacter nitroguajacolicus]NWL13506.1 helix-turn-helix domain-containing protein [Paenarthrobacter nitroguajacolicus]
MALVGVTTLLTLPEAADRLRKSPAQLRWMLHNGSAPRSAKIGGRRMFRESDINDYINQAFEQSAA